MESTEFIKSYGIFCTGQVELKAFLKSLSVFFIKTYLRVPRVLRVKLSTRTLIAG